MIFRCSISCFFVSLSRRPLARCLYRPPTGSDTLGMHTTIGMHTTY